MCAYAAVKFLTVHLLVDTGDGQNNRNSKKLRNRICFGYIERISIDNSECSSICLHSVVLVSVH
jgi:hypothetical protein